MRMSTDEDNSNSSSTDFEDSQDFIVNSQEVIKPTKKRKRRERSKKSQDFIMSLDEKKEHISLLDPSESLAVYPFLNSYYKDVIVKCFVDMFLEHKVIPILPEQEKLKDWLKHNITVNVSKDLMKMLINNFMKYFQVKYFNNNVSNALKEDKALFNPTKQFWIPGFNELPLDIHHSLHKKKLEYVKQVQEKTVQGTNFVLQNFVLRNIDLTMLFIKRTLLLQNEEEIRTHLEYILAMAYSTAKVEFPKSYNVKLIDWRNYDSKATLPLPGWRKEENGLPPKDQVSRLCTNIHKQIDENQVVFEGQKILDQQEKFLQAPYKRPEKRRRFQKKKRNPTQNAENVNPKTPERQVDASQGGNTSNQQRSKLRGNRRSSQLNGNSSSQQRHIPQTNQELMTAFI